MRPRVLIGCEHSGVVRDAFLRHGFDAWSCDLLPSEAPGPHIQGDLRGVVREDWDLAILHPECTFLCNSGVRWLYTEPGRWEKMREAAEFFRFCLNAPIPRIAVENPVMHRSHGRPMGRTPEMSAIAYDFGLNVNLSTDEGRLINRALWLMLRASLPADSSHREKADGSFFTDAEIQRLKERFP